MDKERAAKIGRQGLHVDLKREYLFLFHRNPQS